MRSSSQRSGWAGSSTSRTPSKRLHGRVTKQDVRGAGLRRWDGRQRITTDWINVFQEPELCFADGDVFVYLREPGQSSRGPAYRVHKEQLRVNGFDRILDKCIERPPVAGPANCLAASCPGCDQPHAMSELYMPAPANSEMDVLFDHHITTRNFFAWLYKIPLAGRALGVSLVTVKDRIDFYRPETAASTAVEMVSYAESQGYLDFRECLDHALATLLLAESLQLEDLWIDAFAHCVGMRQRGLKTSIEYPAISEETKNAISRSGIELELRLERVNKSVSHFFENTLSGNVLGLPEIARDHFDRFRSWLHSFYIEQYGFWPPVRFNEDAIQHRIYSAMYSDFRSLYNHLADSKSSSESASLFNSGGVCTLQNVEAFDRRSRYEPLPLQIPFLPREPDPSIKPFGLQRRKSWNPVTKRRIERDNRNALRIQALITASNRDWTIMECLLVRRYSEFEVQSIVDESETISMADGRKVRWILIYAILQILVSVMKASPQVRNVDGLTYMLCCRTPSQMPWYSEEEQQEETEETSAAEKRVSRIEPDVDHLKSMKANHASESTTNVTKRDRRLSLPTRSPSTSLRSALSIKSGRPPSLRGLLTRRNSTIPDVPEVPKSPGFCEILVEGYGNGLNEVQHQPSATAGDPIQVQTHESSLGSITQTQIRSLNEVEEPLRSPISDHMPDLTPTSSTSVSRESSHASNKDIPNRRDSVVSPALPPPEPHHPASPQVVRRSKSARTLQGLMNEARLSQIQPLSPPLPIHALGNPMHGRVESKDFNKILDEKGFSTTVHINTSVWDEMLGTA